MTEPAPPGANGSGGSPGSPGERLFARYAYAPNHLGYCGPADAAALESLASTGTVPDGTDIAGIASRFSGAWPYLVVLAELAGIADPLDERVVRAYWTGGPLLSSVDRDTFGRKLIDRIGPAAGHYWSHLTDDLLPEAAPTHGFHVFGVYPWTRLLASGAPDAALNVLDSCRIRWGQVVSVSGSAVTIRTSRLTWDGARLGIGEDVQETVPTGFVSAPGPGDWLAVHWDHVSDLLTAAEADELADQTDWQLMVTNERLARA